ncbi:MAG: HAMP domain-containing histidine kinase [Rhizobiales bacterium]|nr:HAMP domain-containing histidine kinase [Hyphomicrobiales bacterium]
MAEPAERPSLVATLARRIVFFALIAMAAQLAIVFAAYYFDDAELGSLIVERETALLAEGIGFGSEGWRFTLPEDAVVYSLAPETHMVRIRADDGSTIYSNCGDRCILHMLPEPVDPPDSWSRLLSVGKPISVAGGRAVTIGSERVAIEIAVVDETEASMWRALAHEFIDHLAIPMSLQLGLVLAGALISAALALRPLKAAAREAEGIDPLDPENRIATAQLPREVAELGDAVNRTLERIGRLMREQKLFTTALAHEIRTPLAMLKLELGAIRDPAARRMEADIDDLARLVGQITALGRLEAIGRSGFTLLQPLALVRSVAASIGPFVYDRDHSVGVAEGEGHPFRGDRALIEDALVNLITNAVAHTPAGTAILLAAGPGSQVSVIDDAGLYRREGEGGVPLKADRAGIGLEIVRRIAALHGGTLEIEVEPGRRTTARLRFPEAG